MEKARRGRPFLYNLLNTRHKILRGDCLSLFLDTSALTAAFALVEDLGTTYPTGLVEVDRLDIRGEQRESSFYAYSIGDFTYSESGCLSFALTLEHVSFEALNTLLVPFNDLIIDSDIITGSKIWKIFFPRQLLVYKSYSSVHNFYFLRMAKVMTSGLNSKYFILQHSPISFPG